MRVPLMEPTAGKHRPPARDHRARMPRPSTIGGWTLERLVKERPTWSPCQPVPPVGRLFWSSASYHADREPATDNVSVQGACSHHGGVAEWMK